MAERPDSTRIAGSIDVPTLVITSTQDQLIPAAVGAEMASRIAGARLETLEDPATSRISRRRSVAVSCSTPRGLRPPLSALRPAGPTVD